MKYLFLFCLSSLLWACSDSDEQILEDPYIGEYIIESHECSPFAMTALINQNISVDIHTEGNSEVYKIIGFSSEDIILDENLKYNSPLTPFTRVNIKLAANQILINTEILNINSYESCEYLYVKNQ